MQPTDTAVMVECGVAPIEGGVAAATASFLHKTLGSPQYADEPPNHNESREDKQDFDRWATEMLSVTLWYQVQLIKRLILKKSVVY